MCITPLTETSTVETQSQDIHLYIKREDLLVPEMSGNKWRKLKYNLIDAKMQGFNTLLSFGGAYSNHIYALAAAGKKHGFNTIGIIRGEEHLPLNPTLSFARAQQMRLHYVSREDYRRKEEPTFINELKKKFGDFYLLPEGGTNQAAVQGCEEIAQNIHIDFDYICCACGTGGTLSGIVRSLKPGQKALGFAALKGGAFLEDVVQHYNGPNENWTIIHDYHFGGYAKFDDALIGFIKQFKKDHNIPLEPIYTGKMVYGIFDLLKKGYFPRGAKIIAIHTGGLQGIAGLKERGLLNEL